jgi:multidrug resistance efflux pump
MQVCRAVQDLQKNRWRPLALTVTSFILWPLLLLGGGCGNSLPATVEQKPAVVEITPLERRDIYESLTVSGQVSACSEIKVLVELPGRVEEINVSLGDKVEKGDLLVKLDSRDQEVQLQQAGAALAAARAQLAEALAGARPQDLTQARAGLMQAESAYETAKTELERMEVLYREGIISLQQLEMARTQYTAAEAGMQTARAIVEKMEEGVSEHTLQALRAQVQQAEAGTAAARRQYERMFLKAPISGKVAMVMVREGEMAGTGSPAVFLVDDDPVYIDVFVDEMQVGYLAPGQEVRVEVPAAVAYNHGEGVSGDSLGGIISGVSPASLSGSRSFQVRVNVPNSQGDLKHGMFARATLNTRFWEDAIMVPATAVQQREGRDYIFFYDSGIARAAEIKTGVQQEGMIQVEGELFQLPVIIRAPRSLSDGDTVQTPQDIKDSMEAGEAR